MIVHALDIVHADRITPMGAQEPVRRQLLRQFVQGEMDFQFLLGPGVLRPAFQRSNTLAIPSRVTGFIM